MIYPLFNWTDKRTPDGRTDGHPLKEGGVRPVSVRFCPDVRIPFRSYFSYRCPSVRGHVRISCPDRCPIENLLTFAHLSAILLIGGDGMLKASFYLTRNEMAALKRMKRKTGLPVAELIRRALDEFISQHQDLLHKLEVTDELHGKDS